MLNGLVQYFKVVLIHKAYFCKPYVWPILIPKYDSANSFVFQSIIKKISLPTQSSTMTIISKIALNNVVHYYNVLTSNGIHFSVLNLLFSNFWQLNFSSFLKNSISFASRTTRSPRFPLASPHCQSLFLIWPLNVAPLDSIQASLYFLCSL